jgi:hypothetical protein
MLSIIKSQPSLVVITCIHTKELSIFLYIPLNAYIEKNSKSLYINNLYISNLKSIVIFSPFWPCLPK